MTRKRTRQPVGKHTTPNLVDVDYEKRQVHLQATQKSVVLYGEGWSQEDSVLMTEALSEHEGVELSNDRAHESLTVVPC
jgi:hypothetical protein